MSPARAMPRRTCPKWNFGLRAAPGSTQDIGLIRDTQHHSPFSERLRVPISQRIIRSIFCHSRRVMRRLPRSPRLRPPVGQPLAGDALQSGDRALRIADASIVPAEIELANVALQVSL